MSDNFTATVDRAQWLELQRIAPLQEAAKLSGLSIDTLKRRYGDKIITLSERRLGMRVKHALMLNAPKSKEPAA